MRFLLVLYQFVRRHDRNQATQAMRTVQVGEQLDLGQISSARDDGAGVNRVKGLTAPPAGFGPAIARRMELLGWDQGVKRLGMTGLSLAV
jgi:hypothetical protein